MITIKNKELDVSVLEVLEVLKDYIYERTDKLLFKDIVDKDNDNLMITCPFHKDGYIGCFMLYNMLI